jgi:hypothetical protein
MTVPQTSGDLKTTYICTKGNVWNIANSKHAMNYKYFYIYQTCFSMHDVYAKKFEMFTN